MEKIVNLKVTMEVNGNAKLAVEELRKSVLHCNCVCGSVHKGESFNYKITDAEITK